MELIRAMIQGKEYIVNGDDIKINTTNDGDDTVMVDGAVITVDGVKTDVVGETFLGHKVNAEEAACDIIRAFINDNRKMLVINPQNIHKKIVRAWLDFADFTELSEESGHGFGYFIRIIPKKYLGKYGVLDLQMVNKDKMSYYSDGNECVMIRKDGSVATDYEFLYENSFAEDMENGNHIYLSPEFKN